ncbi:MAG TPA: ATP-binding protein [Dehalococcoidia bacterium]|nr:ATP-binding protein [Dehalococcoidia bacterium]
MLWSLRARLTLSFALVVALAVFLAGASALFLLRDSQQETARERYGRQAEPLNERVARLAAEGRTLDEIRAYLSQTAADTNVRILLLDADQVVIFDSADRLVGTYILAFEGREVQEVESAGARFRWVNFNRDGTPLTLFSAPEPEENSQFATPAYQAIVAIERDELASAWLDLVPRLALAGTIALTVSFLVSYFISRSISGPLGRITNASKEMAKGNYDVHIPIRGEDEVGRLAEAFNQMAREVSRNQGMMKDLLANVSHELKTPLTSIQGFSQAIMDGVISDDDIREYSRTIHDEAHRMRGLVDDLLLLSQIESGQVVMRYEPVDLRALLEASLDRFQWSIREANIETRLRLDRIPMVHGDPRRLEQVFSNLLQNAVRHTPPGGVITVSATTLAGGNVSASVHNTGSVIPKEDLPRVFERFFQVDRARTRKGGSSGLGLSIVKEIVEAHGGSVKAVSSETAGTEFIVILPNPEAQNGKATRPAEQAPRGLERRTDAGLGVSR